MNKKAKRQTDNKPVFEIRLLRPAYWATWMALFVFYLFSWLPLPLMNRAGEKLGELSAKKNKKRFNIAQANLSACFPDKSSTEIEAMVVAHFRAHMRGLLNYGLIWWAPLWRLKKLLVTEGFEQIDEAIEQDRKIIILTCHSAGLEFVGIALSLYYDCSGPYKPMRNEVIDWLVARGRTRLGTIAYTREQGLRPLIRDTRSGRLLIYLADEDLGPDVSVFAPFFGVQKATIPVLGRLAKSCDAVVFPCIGCYDVERRAYRIKVMPRIDNYPAGDDVVDATTMNRVVESMVEECLPQYFWTLRLFQTRPPGEESIYE